MSGEPPANPRRPSGAPEIPEVLRDQPPPTPPKRRWSLLPGAKSSEMKAISVGLDFAAMVGGATLIGWGLAEWRGSRAWLWTWIAIGFVCAAWKFYTDARALNAELSRAERRSRGGQ